MRIPARITGAGCYLPERVLTNADLERIVDTTDEWIVERTGIRERRVAAPHETSSSMGAEAARRALASAGIDGAEVDLVVAGTCTPDGMFPAVATRIQDAIGARGATAFDVNAACNGFLSALSAASQFIGTGAASKVLVVGTETMTRILDWTDRGTCVLFGDGAGAVLLERAQEGEPGAIESFLLRSDGSQAGLLYATGPAGAGVPGALRGAAGQAVAQEAACLVMDGRNVFRQAVTMLSQASEDAMAEAGITIDDIALCVPHQANVRILQAMAKNMGLPASRVYVNLDRYGNTSSATIPIALAEAAAEGRLQPGDHVLLAAFGGGLSWGAMVVEWAGIRVPSALVAPVPVAASVSR